MQVGEAPGHVQGDAHAAAVPAQPALAVIGQRIAQVPALRAHTVPWWLLPLDKHDLQVATGRPRLYKTLHNPCVHPLNVTCSACQAILMAFTNELFDTLVMVNCIKSEAWCTALSAGARAAGADAMQSRV